jgi:O-antigen/teichoic acid export membrane protein
VSSQDTRGRFLRSSGAAILSQGWRVVVTFGTMLVLKRLIPASDWGLWDWALPVFMILGAVRDLGLVYHVVRVEPRPYGNLLALELVWGGLLVGLTFLGAPLLAEAYADPHPEILNVLRAMSLFLLFEGLSTVPRTYFEGELKIGRAVAPEIVRNLFMALASVGLALAGLDVWAVVIANVGAAALYALMLWWRAWGEIPLLYQRGRTLPLVRESLPLASIWFLTILVRHVDPLILGWRFDGPVVGNYVFAYQNAFRVSEVIVPALARALYPALVAFRAAASKLFEAYALATLFMQSFEVPVAYFLFLNAELTLEILGGAQWVAAPAYLKILCFAPIIDPFSRLGGEVLKTEHMDRVWILCTLITLATFVGGGIYLTGAMGPIGMAWINLLPLGAILMAWALHRVAPAGFRTLTGQLLYIYLVPLPFFAAAWWLADDGTWLRFALSLVATAVSLAILWRRFGGGFLAFFRGGGAVTEVVSETRNDA